MTKFPFSPLLILLSLALSTGFVFSAGQASKCAEGHTCFSIQLNLPVEPEGDREGFKRPSHSRYQAQEREIYHQLRMDQTPYTCTSIGGVAKLDQENGRGGMDVEHIVSLAEAHDSGLSPEDMGTFAYDPANLTVATPNENQHVKNHHDATDYLPPHNTCWFAARVVMVKQKWGLSVDRREADALNKALADCTPEEIARPTCLAP